MQSDRRGAVSWEYKKFKIDPETSFFEGSSALPGAPRIGLAPSWRTRRRRL
jgi:hypothetical protein